MNNINFSLHVRVTPNLVEGTEGLELVYDYRLFVSFPLKICSISPGSDNLEISQDPSITRCRISCSRVYVPDVSLRVE